MKIADLTADKNAELISNHVQSINCEEGGFSLPKMYALKKKIFPQAGNSPSAMKDHEGNIVSGRHAFVVECVKKYKEYNNQWRCSLYVFRFEKQLYTSMCLSVNVFK